MSPGSSQHKDQFWFNAKTLQVEQGLKTAAVYRIGPFETRQEAERALEIVSQRATDWNQEDSETER